MASILVFVENVRRGNLVIGVLVVLGLLVASCSDSADSELASSSDIAVVPLNSEGSWDPNDDLIMAIENKLPKLLEDPTTIADEVGGQAAANDLVLELDNFRRQYWGEQSEERRIVVTNALCSADSDWMSEPILIANGGSCYWHAIFDAETLDVLFFDVNSEVDSS